MNSLLTKAGAATLFSVIAFSGCANIKDDRARTKTEGTLMGIGVGTVVGAGVAALKSGGDTNAIIAGAIIGGTAGGFAGHAYGSKVADRKAQYASNEAYLSACIAELQRERQHIRMKNAQRRKAIALQKQELNQLIALRTNNEPTNERFVALNGSVKKSLKVAKDDLNRTNTLIGDHKAAIERSPGASSGSGGYRAWGNELASLEAERAELQAGINTLNSVENSTTQLIAQSR